MKGFDFVETVSGGADIKFADDNRVIEVGQAMYAQAASSPWLPPSGPWPSWQ